VSDNVLKIGSANQTEHKKISKAVKYSGNYIAQIKPKIIKNSLNLNELKNKIIKNSNKSK
jgi:hypothetical protein